MATGGLSIPKMGATGFGYEVARQFGLAIVEPRPGLVPLVFAPEDQARWCDLAGLSAEVVASAGGLRAGRRKGAEPPLFREKLLVTHRGLSGPAVLQVSSYWRPGEAVEFDLAPGREVTAELRSGSARRDEPHWGPRCGVCCRPDGGAMARSRCARTPRSGVFQCGAGPGWSARLHAWRVEPAGTEGFAKAEVTAGGV